ncbi:MAG: ATP-dependent zinc metalloprotease FtsH, partial [Eubacteriales bacterium]
EAALLAARKDRKVIIMPDLEESIIKVIAGPEKKSRVVSERERRLTAIHEAGHAVVMHRLATADPVHQITIIPRGGAGGMTISLPTEDKSFASRNEMYEDIVAFLGGRVAEQLHLDDISTGASNDLQRATALARDMVAKYGMSDALGAVSYDEGGEIFVGNNYEKQVGYSQRVAGEIDHEVTILMKKAYEHCTKIIEEHHDKLEQVAAYLLENDHMSGKDFATMMDSKPVVKADVLEEQE